MSSGKVLLYVIIWGLVGWVASEILVYIFGEQTGSIIFWGLLVLCVVGSFIYDRHWASKSFADKADLSPPPDELPSHIQEQAAELEAMGFRPVVMLQVKKLFENNKVFVYVNRTRNIFAYLRPEYGGFTSFSCYLDDGMDITTHYKRGRAMDSDNLISRVVETSLSATLDYHKHHVHQQAKQHGRPKKFKNYREVMTWEDAQQYNVSSNKEATKQSARIWLRLVLGIFLLWPFLSIVQALLLVWGLFLIGILPIDLLYSSFFIPMIGILSFLMTMAWVYRPLYKPETVEGRKKKHA